MDFNPVCGNQYNIQFISTTWFLDNNNITDYCQRGLCPTLTDFSPFMLEPLPRQTFDIRYTPPYILTVLCREYTA